MRRFPILPTLVTLGNLFCGFLAIGYVLKAQGDPGKFGVFIRAAGWLIFLAMVFDALDGKLARLYNVTSDFGAELDSLCDMVSFGVAPGLIIKVLADHQDYMERLGLVVSVFFVACVALRLARFNVETQDSEEAHQHFRGLPSPAGAAFIAAMTILYFRLSGDAPQEFAGLAKALKPVMGYVLKVMPVVGAILGVLMVSHMRYVHVLSRLMRGREPLPYLVALMLLVLVVFITRPFSLPLLIGAYVLSGVVVWAKELVLSRLAHKTVDGAP